MPYGMYISAAGAAAQTRQLEVISNNMANAHTVGFKPDFAIEMARHAEAIERGADHPSSESINNVGGGIEIQRTATNFARGITKQTSIPSDLAIVDQNGDVFFKVERDGETLLTRAGNFRFSGTGQLLTQNGATVLSTEGEPIFIDPEIPEWQFNEDGSIQQGEERIPLAMERPVSLGDLAKAGNNEFRPLGETIQVAPNERRVRSGYLEMSAVSPTHMMMDMIKTSRVYEANVRLIQHQDHMMGTLVNRALRQS